MWNRRQGNLLLDQCVSYNIIEFLLMYPKYSLWLTFGKEELKFCKLYSFDNYCLSGATDQITCRDEFLFSDFFF